MTAPARSDDVEFSLLRVDIDLREVARDVGQHSLGAGL